MSESLDIDPSLIQAKRAISIVIRTFNSARTLGSVVAMLHLQKSDEIIVVDSGSTDETVRIARDLNAKVVIAEGPFNYSKSLNLGFKAARNPWVLVLSSHARPQNTQFLDLYRRSLEDLAENIAVIYGSSTITGTDGVTSNNGGLILYDSSNCEEILILCGNGNALYRKSSWVKLPFDENIRTAEDKIWLQSALDRGWHFGFLPAVCTLNQNQASLLYMFRKGYGDARALPRTPSFRAMNLYQFGGALKNQAKLRLYGKIDHGNWIRYTAHIFGQYFGSRGRQNNTPGYQ